MTIWKRVAVVAALTTCVCSGLMGLSLSLRTDTSVGEIIEVHVPPTASDFQRLGRAEDRVSPEGEAVPRGEPLSEAAFAAWRTAYLSRMEDIDRACGSRSRVACDDKACVLLYDERTSARLWELARRPEQVAERALVQFAGFPEEVDSCLMKQRAQRGEDVTFGLSRSGDRFCWAHMPAAEADEGVAARHASALCDAVFTRGD